MLLAVITGKTHTLPYHTHVSRCSLSPYVLLLYFSMEEKHFQIGKNILVSHNLLCHSILIFTNAIEKLYHVTHLTTQSCYSNLLRPCDPRSNPFAISY